LVDSFENILVVYMHTRQNVNGIKKYFLMKGDY